ncbi:MAG: hypothetical protein K1X50_21235 [Candidatus Promineofilum sp.]|nr:hypothetical protein [Promineifilum sp.]MCW5861778.1 hypothetical protein [Anaerolineae bacterium]
MTAKQINREVFVASADELAKLSEEERDDVFARMAHDAVVAANKVLAARGEPLFDVVSVEEAKARLARERAEEG